MVKAAAAAGHARRARRRARDAHRHPPRRRRHRHHLPRQGRRPMASVDRPRSARARTARPSRSTTLDKQLLNLMQGCFPLEPRPYAARRASARASTEDEVLRARRASCSTSGSSARSRRSSTPARSATARCSSRPRSTPSTRSAPRRSSTRTPASAHNYLRNHEFNLWFTIAVEPDSELGLAGHARRARRSSTGAESIRQLPTLKLFKIRMDLEMEGGTDALATAAVAEEPRRARASSPTTSSTCAVIRATQGDLPVVARALRAGRRASSA